MIKVRDFWMAVVSMTAASFMVGSAALADHLEKPAGKVLLTVTGDVEAHNNGDKAVFDLAMLEKYGRTEIETTTAWTEGVHRFEGILISTLMDEVGAIGTTAEVIALNDYKVDIPVGDFTDYPVILAYRMDGERLRIRDKGPLWVIYPQDDHPELKNKDTQAKWVWQVKEIRFK